MRINRGNRFHAEVSTHSLNDIMFFLLLFFLIVSTIANPNVIKILLPRPNNHQKAVRTDPCILTVIADKRYYIYEQELPFEGIEGKLLAQAKHVDSLTVVLRVPKDLLLQDLVDVMQIGTRNKFKMVLAADKK